MNFAVVSYPDEYYYLGVIPTNWITLSGNSCFYPKVATNFMRNKLISTREEPRNNWREVDIKILEKFDTYENAKNYLKLAETTNDLGSSPDVSKSSSRVSQRSRKKRKILLPGESSSSDDELRSIKKFLSSSYTPPSSSSAAADSFSQSSHSDKDTHRMAKTPKTLTTSNPPNLTHCIVQLSPLNNVSQTSLYLENHQQIRTSSSNQTEDPLSGLEDLQTLPKLETNTPLESQVFSKQIEQTPSLTNSTEQIPPRLTNHTEQPPPTLTSHTMQTPTILKPQLKQCSQITVPSGSPKITEVFSASNQTPHVSKCIGLLRPAPPSSLQNPRPHSLSTFVDVISTSGDVSLQSSLFQSSGNGDSSPLVESEIQSLRRSLEMLWALMGESSKKLDTILATLERIETKSNVHQCPESNLQNGSGVMNDDLLIVNLPLNSTNFEEFDNNLKDPAFRQRVFNLLVNVTSGSTIKQLAMNIMKKLITNDLAEQYSFSGKIMGSFAPKKPFSKTKSYLLICQICQRRYVDAQEKDVREGVSAWLQQAKTRRVRKEMNASDNLKEQLE